MGGGIPILRPLTDDLAANRISEVCGILNGTTNYILTRMAREGVDFHTALAEAQRLGYAEAEPRRRRRRATTPAAKSAFWRAWPSAGASCRSRCPPGASLRSRPQIWPSPPPRICTSSSSPGPA